MSSIFCIPCKYVKGNDLIFKCVENIRKFHKDVDILVVDSNSEDTSYLETLKEQFDILYDDFRNVNFPTGAYWHCYNNYKRDFYYFIHDSILIERNISEYESKDITSMMYFKSYFREHDYNTRNPEEIGRVGLVGPQSEVEWSIKKLEDNNIKPNYYFTGIVGSSFLAKREVLDRIYDTGFSKILPDTKVQDGNMERLWGVIIDLLGYDVLNNTIIGNFLETPQIDLGNNSYYKGNNGVYKYSYSRF